MDTLKRLVGDRRTGEAWQRLWLLARDARDYATFRALCRIRKKLAALEPPTALPASARVALLSGATTSMIEEPLQLALEALGVNCTLHASDYGSFASEMIQPDSATVAFKPDAAVVINTPANIPTWPAWNADDVASRAAVDEVCEYWLGLCRTLHEAARCDVVLATFHALPLSPLGTAGTRLPGERNRFLRSVNEALAIRAPAWLHLHDVAGLAAFHGIERWFDARFWYHARQPVSFDCLVPYVRSLAQIVGALFGRSAKCVVVDLDNTIWGGVVGDDGPDRLVLGEGNPEGEAFLAFQRYLSELRERGILLAVSSKNDEAQAIAPFSTRPEMVLHREDFVAFKANWRPKSENLREIAAELNIGLDAMVFVDDNPAERAEIRQALPDVRVAELGDEPADFPGVLDRSGWLDLVTVSAEDRTRTVMVQADAARARAQTATGDYGTYLRSLLQRAVIAPFSEPHLDRITQLTNKTNQFNLTTRRMSRSELAAWLASPHHLTTCVRLADRFGDNGLISVLAARVDGFDVWIDLWLMSCRVLNRGVEQLVCNDLAARAKARGCRILHGLYLPTPRNGVVKDLFARLGFAHCGPLDGGEHWSLDLTAFRELETAVAAVADY